MRLKNIRKRIAQIIYPEGFVDQIDDPIRYQELRADDQSSACPADTEFPIHKHRVNTKLPTSGAATSEHYSLLVGEDVPPRHLAHLCRLRRTSPVYLKEIAEFREDQRSKKQEGLKGVQQ